MDKNEKDFEQRQLLLIQKLSELDVFRRGSINTVYRKCGKKGCSCANEGHPGHGPMATLTFKESNRTITRSIPAVAVDLVQGQIDARSHFLDWCNRWRELSEERSDWQVQRLIGGEEEKVSGKKKSFRRWSRKLAGK
jgi:hypothetical protein